MDLPLWFRKWLGSWWGHWCRKCGAEMISVGWYEGEKERCVSFSCSVPLH